MKKILQYLFEHKTLSKEQAKVILTDISNGKYNDHEITAFITVFMMRSITIDELEGFRDALLELSVKTNFADKNVIDIVGTGGDGKNTFNISTLSCFIVAGAGKKVVKHGNYGASTISGASNVMEELGYRFSNNNSNLNTELEKTGICFLHAPLFHPALKAVGPIRKNLGIRSFFNMLGPVVNPASPNNQVIGVFNLEMARVYNYLLQKSGKSFTIVHGLDGYDEISLTGDSKVITNKGEFIFSPEKLGKRMVSASDIHGGNTTKEAAAIFKKIISGQGSWAQNAVVIANAAVALHCTGEYADYEQAYDAAVDSLDNGKALATLNALLEVNKQHKP